LKRAGSGGEIDDDKNSVARGGSIDGCGDARLVRRCAGATADAATPDAAFLVQVRGLGLRVE